ncbi:MAG: SDR family NAD(P)-dependent oxidoreductase [Aeromicrobium sp.]|uniref:SDR family NAD(P)-dependent oxidoreductase n=1 Tax=Aeromicrobium sp. TaxID=1871063 RepID=UPI0039E2C638
MSVIAIIGAGPGLGAATARRFGPEGFTVALVSRTPEKLQKLCEELAADGVTAHAFPADVEDPAALTAALKRVAADLGPVEVLQYSPVPRMDFLRPVLEITTEQLAAATNFSIIGSATAVQAVVPAMVEAGRGTILLANGSSAVTPNANYAGTSVAFAGESAYGLMLHEALAPQGVHVGQLIIPGAIDGDDPLFASDALADRLWAMHTERGEYRRTVGA